LDQLFSKRRLERDERLRVALDSRPEGAGKPPFVHDERRTGERSNSRGASGSGRVLTRSYSLVLGVLGAALTALAVIAAGGLAGKSEAERLAPPQPKMALPTGAVGAPRAPEPVTPESARELAVRDEREPADGDSLGNKRPRVERRAIDVSPVREVGF
ncbi:MAG TPA: hypothetical protein VMS65_09210, partial [Polyangiaceae bacterium]|nr:hypothetical protein [Polyangiaceae bacterium]